MLRLIAITLSLLFPTVILADVFSNVQQCLSGSVGAGQTKISCVTSAIGAEETNQQNNLFTVFSNFYSQDVNSTGGGAGAATIAPPSIQQPSSPQFKAPAPTKQPATTTAPPAPAAQPSTTPPPPKSTGGIQYF